MQTPQEHEQVQCVAVALPLPTLRLFTYKLPVGVQVADTIGCRLLVPFGKNVLTGIAVGEGELTDTEAKIRPVEEVLDTIPTCNSVLLRLTKWMAEFYFCSWGEALKSVIPQGLAPKTTSHITLLYRPTDSEIIEMERRAPRRAAILRELIRSRGTSSIQHLEMKLRAESLTSALEGLIGDGWIKLVRTLSQEAGAKEVKAVRIAPLLLADREHFKELLTSLDSKAPKQALLLSRLYVHAQRASTPIPAQELLKTVDAPATALAALVKKGFVTEEKMAIRRDLSLLNAGASLARTKESEVLLTDEQAYCLAHINNALTEGGYKAFLLHGVTGSGKTIVYMKAIATALTLGKSALLLVPEISLTPQLIDRFEAVFPGKVTLFHSKMSVGERYDAWRAARDGEVQLLLGARSALFAPLSNVGIIIVDEEHESSYKQTDPAPRYHARDTALMRASLENAVIILGSATPSLESLYNAHAGKYHLLEIRSRADGAALPAVKVIDMQLARKKGLYQGAFSFELLNAIRGAVSKKEGVILFQNRRGFSSFVECNDCAFIPSCPHCSVSLTYHKQQRSLRCHYCGYAHPAISTCPQCGGDDIVEAGAGTQRIEEELSEHLQQYNVKAAIERLDLDTTRKKNSMREILTRFAKGETDILVGTQMVTKGIDFSRVSLVGVINADVMLYVPDFRAAERTFQLLTQVAGRAGRSSELPGQVFIQTATPEHPSVLAAKLHSLDLFYNDELQYRKDAFYPPFSRFVLIECSGKKQSLVEEQAKVLARLFPPDHEAFEILGPAPAPIEKLRSHYRFQIILKGRKEIDPTSRLLRHFLSHALQEYRRQYSTSSVKLTIDIDSYGG